MTVNREDLKAFVDGELTADASNEFRTAIERDGALAEDVAFMKLLGEGVRELASEPQVVGAEAVLEKFRARPSPTPLFVLGGLVAAVAIGTVLIPQTAGRSEDVAMTAATVASGPSIRQGALQDSGRNAGEQAKSGSTSGETNAYFLSNRQAKGAERSDRGDPVGITPPLLTTRESRLSPLQSPASPSFGGGGFGGRSGRSLTNAAKSGEQPRITNSPQDLNGSDVNVIAGSDARIAASPAPVSPESQSRMVVQTGDLDEVVHDVSTAQNEAGSYVKGIGGFIASSSLDKDDSDLPQANLSLRVPVRDFNLAMNHFKGFALDATHVKSFHITGEDVTTQYADSTARAKVMQAEEESYVTMLRGARNVGQILEIKDRLSTVREQIESLHAQADALKNTSQLSTINLVLEQQPKAKPAPKPWVAPVPPSWSSQTWNSAADAFGSLLRSLGALGIFLLVFSPIWVPLGFLSYWLYRRYR